MWNRRCLVPPPECNLKVKLTETDIDAVLLARGRLEESRYKVREHVRLLGAEHYVTKRIIYKCVNQMRRDKALATFRQVNNCLKRLEQLKVEPLLETLYDYVDIELRETSCEVHLPSLQLLQYNLVRLMSLAALLTQTACYCGHTYQAVQQYLRLGNLVQHYLIIMAACARIWYVCRALRAHVYNWYKALYPCLHILAPTQAPWFCDTESLASDLPAWIHEQFGEQPQLQLSEKTASGHELSGVDLDLGGLPLDVEDLGVPVQRSVPQEAALDNEQPFPVTVNLPRKKKKQNKSTKTAADKCETDVTNADDSLLTDRIKMMKKHMKLHLKCADDLNDVLKGLKNKKLTIGGKVIVLSKVGKRKVFKKIEAFRSAAAESGTDTSVEMLLFKKLRLCLGRLMVKFEKCSKNLDFNEKCVAMKNNTVNGNGASNVSCEVSEDDAKATGESVVKKKIKKNKLKENKRKLKDKIVVEKIRSEKSLQHMCILDHNKIIKRQQKKKRKTKNK